MHIDDLLKIAAQSGASDLHLKVGSYPMMRVNGLLAICSEEKRNERADTESMADSIFTGDQREKFRQAQEVDLAYSLPGVGRLVIGAVLRRDWPVIQGGLLMTAGVFVLVNLLVDLLYLWADPRLRER